jgi:hypothetical protein
VVGGAMEEGSQVLRPKLRSSFTYIQWFRVFLCQWNEQCRYDCRLRRAATMRKVCFSLYGGKHVDSTLHNGQGSDERFRAMMLHTVLGTS